MKLSKKHKDYIKNCAESLSEAILEDVIKTTCSITLFGYGSAVVYVDDAKMSNLENDEYWPKELEISLEEEIEGGCVSEDPKIYLKTLKHLESCVSMLKSALNKAESK